MEKIILASNNGGKIKEVKEILKDMDIELLPMKEAGADLAIEENGQTFVENALIKARTVAEHTGLPAIADDSGLVVDYLGGEPGIYSARYMGYDTSYDIKNQSIIDRLSKAEGAERSARFVCAVAVVFPEGKEIIATGTMEGQIAYEISGDNGFGYDPILFLPQFGKTSAQLSAEEKNKISHRGEALRKMKTALGQYLKEREG